jgi:large subunit ribosomal protein L24
MSGMKMLSGKPRNQRKEMYNAPMHIKRKNIASHLDENLLLKYDRRSIAVIKGDTVKVIRGAFKGHEDKVSKVNVKKRNVEVEGITMAKADGNKIGRPIHPSNLIITKLNLTDKWRRRKLERNLSEETKKEVEKEAQQQIKEAEEEKKRLEEEQKALEEAEQEEGELEEEVKEEPEEKKTKEVPKEKPKTNETEKKSEEKKKTKEKTTPKKSTTTKKKTPAKKPATKKQTNSKKKTTTKKTPKKKEEK